jgi:hypothetical protein
MVSAAVRRRKAGAPSKWRAAALCAAMAVMRLSALRLPFVRRDFSEAWWWVGLGHKECVARTAFRVVIASDSEAIQSLRGKLDCFVAFAPRNEEVQAGQQNHRVIAGLDPAIYPATQLLGALLD